MKRNSQTSHSNKGIKAVAAVILCLLLLAAEGIVMGMFAIDRALAQDSIEEELADSQMINDYLQEALDASTVNDAGRYGDAIKAVLKTDSMNSFFSSYMTSAIRSLAYGEEYEEVANDELAAAFSQGMDEANEAGTISISPVEQKYIEEQMQAEIPNMTAQLNQIVADYTSASGAVTQEALSSDGSLQEFTGIKYRIAATAICLLFAAGLIALYWRSRFGFLWCGITTAVAASSYIILVALIKAAAVSMTVYATDQFVVGIVQNGFGFAAVRGYIAAAVFIALFIILKIKGKDMRNEEDSQASKRPA